MNRLIATITAREESGPVVLLETRFDEARLSVLVLDAHDGRYGTGQQVDLLFNENEVMVSTDASPALSVVNRLPAIVQSVDFDGVLCRVGLKTGSAILRALMTRRSSEILRLRDGMQVTALIKPSAIIIEERAP